MSFYIYGVVTTKCRMEFGPIGVGEKPVYTIGAGTLAFVVSESEREEYVANSVNLGEHERVLETVMKQTTILPMRFGTVASTEKEIMLMFKRHHHVFTRALTKLEGKVEVEIEVMWKDMKAVFDEIAEQSPALKKLKTDPRAKSREDVIMAGQIVYQLLQEKKRRESEGFIKALKKVSGDCVVNKSARDELMMNSSFLVDKEKLSVFDKMVDSLDAKTGGRFNIRYIGPLPPYSFANIRLK